MGNALDSVAKCCAPFGEPAPTQPCKRPWGPVRQPTSFPPPVRQQAPLALAYSVGFVPQPPQPPVAARHVPPHRPASPPQRCVEEKPVLAGNLSVSSSEANRHDEWIDLGMKKEEKSNAMVLVDTSTAVPTSKGHRGSVSSAPEPPLDQSALLGPLQQADSRSNDNLAADEDKEPPQENLWPVPIYNPEAQSEPLPDSETSDFLSSRGVSTYVIDKSGRPRLPSLPENDMYRDFKTNTHNVDTQQELQNCKTNSDLFEAEMPVIDAQREGDQPEVPLSVINAQREGDQPEVPLSVIKAQHEGDKAELFVSDTERELQGRNMADDLEVFSSMDIDLKTAERAKKRGKGKAPNAAATESLSRRPSRRGFGAPVLRTASRGCRKSCAAAVAVART